MHPRSLVSQRPFSFYDNLMNSTIVIHIISVPIEAAVLWYFLRLSFGKALLMSLIANIASTVVVSILLVSGVMYMWTAWQPGEHTLVEVVVLSYWPITLTLILLLSIVIELGTIKAIWKYSWQQLWLPVVAMNILTHLILAAQYLMSN